MTNPNEPAYPTQSESPIGRFPGLTKREVFAMAAMQGMLASSQLKDIIELRDDPCATVASEALMYADAILAKLAKGEG